MNFIYLYIKMNPLLNLHHLKFFCDAVTYKSVSEAAKMNFVTQSAISQAIGKLEKLFDATLVYHNRQKLHVTLEGEILYQRAKDIFNTVQKTFNTVQESKEEVCGTVRFITTKSLGMSFVAPMYQRFKKQFPSINLKFKIGSKNMIRTFLKRGDVDFAIVVFDSNFDEFKKRPITSGEINLYQAKDAPENLIYEEGVVVCDEYTPFVRELEKYFDDLEDSLIRIQCETGSWELAARFAEMGIGVGFFPDYLLKNNRHPNLKKHPLKIPKYEYEICAIQNHTTRQSKAAETFLENFSME